MSGWLITGASGMLGQDLLDCLKRAGQTAAGYNHHELDLTDRRSVATALDRCQPAVVVNCAAWTAVDQAEQDEEAALAVNGHGVAGLAAACASRPITLVHLSTDYVFAGDAGRPYGEDDTPAPATAYGRSKLAGEQAVLDQLGQRGYIVRTAWLYGANGGNFVRTMIGLERTRSTVDVVDDQRGQPTWTADVARQIIGLAGAEAPGGVYHATSSGDTTWHGLACEVFTLLGADPARVRPVPTSAFPRPAPRPAYSVLGHDRWAQAGMRPIADWRLALHTAFPELLRVTDQSKA